MTLAEYLIKAAHKYGPDSDEYKAIEHYAQIADEGKTQYARIEARTAIAMLVNGTPHLPSVIRTHRVNKK